MGLVQSSVTGGVLVAPTVATNPNAPAIASVGGRVICDAGTNLNTSALALESGGNLAGIKSDTASIKTNTTGLALETGGNLAGVKTNTDTIKTDVGTLKTTICTTSFDALSNTITTIRHSHDEIHEGKRWVAGRRSTVGSGATYDYLFTCGAKAAHAVLYMTSDQTMGIDIYEGPTINANGTSLTAYNRNRTSANTPVATTYHNPTIGAVGTLFLSELIGAGKSSGQTRAEDEIVLNASTSYLVRITNIASGTANYSFNFDWYEI